jgi:MFS family permease
MAGFVLMGLAVAGVVPTALTAAGRLAPGSSGATAGRLMAAVYVAFIVSPPLVGWLAERASLRAALLVVGLSGLGILCLRPGAAGRAGAGATPPGGAPPGGTTPGRTGASAARQSS